MTRLIRSEIRKLTSVTWFKVTIVAADCPHPCVRDHQRVPAGRNGNAQLGTPDNIHHVLSSSALTSMVMLAIGIAMAANEYRHNTSIPTFLVTPRRRDVVVAKLVTAAMLGAVFGASRSGSRCRWRGTDVRLKGVHHLAGDTPPMLLGAIVATALYGALGVALGAMTRSVVARRSSPLDLGAARRASLPRLRVPAARKWLPTGANLAITRTTRTRRAARSGCRRRSPPSLDRGPHGPRRCG